MMNDQEMQFADPEWRPGQHGSQAGTEPEPYHPQPVNRDRPNQSNTWEEPVPEHVYAAQEPSYQQFQPPPLQQPQVGGIYGQVRPRRRRSIWPWIIAAFILFSVIGGTIGRSASEFGHHMGMNSSVPAQQVPFDQTKQFTVGAQPIINIYSASGTVNVHTSGAASEVIVQTQGPGNANFTQTDASTLTIDTTNNPSFSDISVTVTVPANANLVIHTTDGDVNVDGVSGQLSVISDSGSIGLTNMLLSDGSTVQTTSGDITFSGQLDSSGSYRFISSNGSIDLTPLNSSFQVTATTNSGDIQSDFSSVAVQQTSNGNGAVMHGTVGSDSHATLTISTDSGSINLHSR